MFLGKVVLTAACSLNQMPNPLLSSTSPSERLYGQVPNYSLLRVFAFACLVHLPKRDCTHLSLRFMCLLGVQCQSKRLILLWSSDQKVTCLSIPSLIVPFTKNIPTEKYSIHPKILVHVSILTSQRGKLGEFPLLPFLPKFNIQQKELHWIP